MYPVVNPLHKNKYIDQDTNLFLISWDQSVFLVDLSKLFYGDDPGESVLKTK